MMGGDKIYWERLNLQNAAAGARSITEIQPQQTLSHQLEIAGELYELLLIPQTEYTWRFELPHLTLGLTIPSGFKLRLLTEDLQPFPDNKAVATTAIQSLIYICRIRIRRRHSLANRTLTIKL
jgi:hypothetical protein